MKKMNLKRLLFASLVAFVLVFVPSCASSPKPVKLNTKESLEGEDFRIFSVPDESSDYIYLRIYNPYYWRKLSGGSIIQAGINLVEIKPIMTSHVAIGFELDDEFYGLTAYARPNLSVEECSNIKSNRYMKQCDPKKSLQTVLAIKVSPEEKEAARKTVLFCSENNLVRYDTAQNFRIASREINKKVFLKEEYSGGLSYFSELQDGSEQDLILNSESGNKPENKLATESENKSESKVEPALESEKKSGPELEIGSELEPESELESESGLAERTKILLPEFDENGKNPFVCSNFAAWVIYMNVPKTQSYFDTNFSDILLVGPSDVASIPGFFPVFTSTWSSYERAVEEIKEEQELFRLRKKIK